MSHRVKILGLAVVAMLAMSAVAANAAFATEGVFKWPSGTTKLTGKQVSPMSATSNQVFTTKFGTVTCEEVNASATVTGTSATTITTTSVAYDKHKETTKSECEAPFGLTAKIEFGKCDYTFHAGTTVGTAAEMISKGTADISCPNAGEHVTINAPGCVITVNPQTGLGPITYEGLNTGTAEEDVRIVPAVTNIVYSATGSLCSGTNLTGGTYKGDVTVTGNNGGITVE